MSLICFVILASVCTAFLFTSFYFPFNASNFFGHPTKATDLLVSFAYHNRFYFYWLTPALWSLTLSMGVWVWKGRTRMAWTNTGFDKDVFKLLMRMKGGTSRLKVLNALSAAPKDRLQLSRELNLDWKTIDRHIAILHNHGLIEERGTFANNIKIFVLTDRGKALTKLVDDLTKLNSLE